MLTSSIFILELRLIIERCTPSLDTAQFVDWHMHAPLRTPWTFCQKNCILQTYDAGENFIIQQVIDWDEDDEDDEDDKDDYDDYGDYDDDDESEDGDSYTDATSNGVDHSNGEESTGNGVDTEEGECDWQVVVIKEDGIRVDDPTQ